MNTWNWHVWPWLLFFTGAAGSIAYLFKGCLSPYETYMMELYPNIFAKKASIIFDRVLRTSLYFYFIRLLQQLQDISFMENGAKYSMYFDVYFHLTLSAQ